MFFYENCFQLNADALAKLAEQFSQFRMKPLAEVVFYRTFSRPKEDSDLKAELENKQRIEEFAKSMQDTLYHDQAVEMLNFINKKIGEKKGRKRRETWLDVIVRVTNGTFSIRKDWMLKHNLTWNEEEKQKYALGFASYMLKMKFLPPGRGLWACGTEFVRLNGSMALNNCGFVDTANELLDPICWLMNALMLGCGVGFTTSWKGSLITPNKDDTFTFVIPDSREGWVESLEKLLSAYLVPGSKFPIFDYSIIRPQGEPIKLFGGIASGPRPLLKLHRRVEAFCDCFIAFPIKGVDAIVEMTKMLKNEYFENDNSMTDERFDAMIDKIGNDSRKTYLHSRLITDICNAIGSCIVSGNVRRSSEIALGNPSDNEFVNLKNMDLNPERSIVCWLSNNTVSFSETDQFDEYIPGVAKGIRDNGEPGVFNLINSQRFGRIGRFINPNDPHTRENERDNAMGLNPCVSGDTLVKTTKGLIPIKDLVGVPFEVIIDNGKKYMAKSCWKTGTKKTFTVTLKNGMSVRATENHPFMSIRSDGWGEWREVRDLEKGVLIATDNNSESSIESIVPNDEEEDVYDCTVDEIHMFSANGIIVSNCGEICLESYELCNLSECFISEFFDKDNNFDMDGYLQAMEYATFYSSTISLLPTASEKTNAVVSRNRRIGVGNGGTALALDKMKYSRLTKVVRAAYKKIREVNTRLAQEAGVPPAIRCTTIKPSGSISLLLGTSPGIHFPICSRYVIRRIRVSQNEEIAPILKDSGIPYEKDIFSDNTDVFEFPLDQGESRTENEVSMWEQFSLAAMFQREFSDNSVSVTIKFDPETEGNQIEAALSIFLPHMKSISMLPKTTGVYKQAPYESISEEEYNRRVSQLRPFDWNRLISDVNADLLKGCDGDKCTF